MSEDFAKFDFLELDISASDLNDCLINFFP